VLSEPETPTQPRSAPTPPPSEQFPPSDREEGLWAYCVAAADASLPAGNPGVEPDRRLERVEHGGLAALVSKVPLAHYGEDALRDNLNNLDWLERVARAHEAVLELALAESTIVPLRLCTIYEGYEGVTGMLTAERKSFEAALDLLDGRQEWGVKVLVDRRALEAGVRAVSADVSALEKEVEASSGGGAYMMGRRVEREVGALAERKLAEVTNDIHGRLADWAEDGVLNPPQNRDLSRHEGEMVMNAAYLVEAGKVARFRELIGELEERYGKLGISLELTGPWPPYNFVPSSASARTATPE
jgi:Gas vesicle synthesis protein GvpL/GvpF